MMRNKIIYPKIEESSDSSINKNDRATVIYNLDNKDYSQSDFDDIEDADINQYYESELDDIEDDDINQYYESELDDIEDDDINQYYESELDDIEDADINQYYESELDDIEDDDINQYYKSDKDEISDEDIYEFFDFDKANYNRKNHKKHIAQLPQMERLQSVKSQNSKAKAHPDTLAEKLIETVNIVSIDSQLYAYNIKKMIYVAIDERYVVAFLRDMLDKAEFEQYSYVELASSVTNFVKTRLLECKIKKPKPELLAFKNGIFNFVTGERIEPSPDIYLTSRINCAYKPKNKHKNVFLEFLYETFDGDEQQIRHAVATIGSLLASYTKQRRIVFLLGKTGSGKSVISQLIAELLAGYSTAISLKDFEKDFEISNLLGANINITPEVPSDIISSKIASSLKAISSGDKMSYQLKYLKSRQVVINIRLLMHSNHMPRFQDKTEELEPLLDRFEFIYFARSIPKERRDKNLIKKLLRERNFIVKYCLDAYAESYINGDILPFNIVNLNIKNEILSSNSVSTERFIKEHIGLSSDEKNLVATSKVYSLYLKYCEKHDYEILSHISLTKAIKTTLNVKMHKTKERCIRGIELKNIDDIVGCVSDKEEE